ncbi:ATP-binding protein [Paenibacillus sp. NFR01]|uniref:ATP-binding protein n=1 Tax=Paenibacillus sp. NFR01 TaxID=1566279 RepID=UPI0008C88C49|nr:ATP-binding protein [Paenibacillus sp. NFR01]SEU23579.1 serine/threonine-protein kinase RsbW [Paenibacillus sp. NFR01]
MSEASGEIHTELLIMHNSDDIVKAMDITRSLAELTGFSEHDCVLLQLVTEEACMNAFEHGCPMGNCEFRISWTVDADAMEITVCQSGEFELQPNREAPLKGGSRGRGLILIQSIMDETRLIPTGIYVSLVMRKGRGHAH